MSDAHVIGHWYRVRTVDKDGTVRNGEVLAATMFDACRNFGVQHQSMNIIHLEVQLVERREPEQENPLRHQ